MRRFVLFSTVLVLASCNDASIPTTSVPGDPLLARGGTTQQLLAVFNTQLRAENEAPHISTSEASGHVQIKIFEDGTFEWKIKVLNPAQETFFAGHIHIGPVGEAGPVVLTLLAETLSAEHFDIRGSAVDPVLAAAILADPSAYYVNLHTTAIPAGAIRGQLP